MVVPHQDKSL